MRCPYCGGFNSERASFCVYCGRDLTSGKQPAQRQQPQPPQQPPHQQPRPAPPPQSYPTRPTPATQQPGQVPAAQRRRAPAMPQQTPVPAAPPAPPAPEAPAPFPPHTVAQLQALEQGALAYTVLDTTTNGQRKKIVRIIYPGVLPGSRSPHCSRRSKSSRIAALKPSSSRATCHQTLMCIHSLTASSPSTAMCVWVARL